MMRRHGYPALPVGLQQFHQMPSYRYEMEEDFGLLSTPEPPESAKAVSSHTYA
jgi:hypothetical protein